MSKTVRNQMKIFTVIAIACTLVLSGCGNGKQDSKSSNTSGSNAQTEQSTTKNDAQRIVKKAKKLITAGEYEQALSLLQKIKSPTNQDKRLIKDVKKLIESESDYKNGNYSSAESSTNSLQQSDTTEVSNAAASLSSKIDSAKTSSAASSSTSGTVAANNASSSTASSTTSDSTNNSVISKFASAIGLYGKSGYGFTIDSQSGSTYTIEVRQNNQANDVANLVGIYQYNSSTGAVTKTN
ncbi:hypothetical protein ABTQ33_10420 [Paucilactobacillus suebicus]|uniref:hypothetical protein n=1 Tax=Paucilactobacillus suebicus TaxID=152335 RepID=UPI0002490612|nr:hypothetical protein [Paucilactobacillus suebicus]